MLLLQAVCDADLVFTDCFIGFAGSVHDARIFRNSDLWHAVSENQNHFFPNNEYIIGDKAYPVLSWCLAPYINRGNMTEVRKFNYYILYVIILYNDHARVAHFLHFYSFKNILMIPYTY